jgi:uncharacterized membrane protein
MFHTVKHVTGNILWGNLHLLFWLSLIPFSTGWIGENHFEPIPMAFYGFILFMAGLAYYILQRTIIKSQGVNSILAKAVGRDYKGKVSPILYFIAMSSCWFNIWIAAAIYVFVALMWLIPDKRIEVMLRQEKE